MENKKSIEEPSDGDVEEMYKRDAADAQAQDEAYEADLAALDAKEADKKDSSLP